MLCEPLEKKQKPITAIDAKFSIPFVVATAIVHRDVNLDHFTPQALLDQEVLKMAKKIKYIVNEGLCPEPPTPGSLTICTKNKSLSKKVDFPLGHPSNPISNDALIEKFMRCSQHSAKKILNKDLKKIIELVLHLDEVKNMDELFKYLY